MKKVKAAVIFIFFLIICIPLITFNREENVVSAIDNRQLTNNPFGDNYVSNGEPLTAAVESYMQDRIGLRDEMILGYTLLNDKAFHEMVHPTYTYGKDDYVFFKMTPNIQYGAYHEAFADMIKKIQDYCSDRGVPFVFVFNPSKTTVLQDELPEGVNYSAAWVDEFMAALDAREINYVNNTPLLIEKTEEGETVFNRQYNAGHWNDLGAFYGVNNILENLKENFYPDLHINSMDEFTVTEKLNESLPVSTFPIHEYEPIFEIKSKLVGLTEDYREELEINPQYPRFRYAVNEERLQEGAPKALVFQGSYMNEMGYKFLDNALGEYISVHDYQNITNFDYYYNIFQPECVIFEVAEYTLEEGYFSYENIKNMELNPPVTTFEDMPEEQCSTENISVNVEAGERLVKISVSGLPEETEYAYMDIAGVTFDLRREDGGESGDSYTVTVEKDRFQEEDMEITAVTGNIRELYIF